MHIIYNYAIKIVLSIVTVLIMIILCINILIKYNDTNIKNIIMSKTQYPERKTSYFFSATSLEHSNSANNPCTRNASDRSSGTRNDIARGIKRRHLRRANIPPPVVPFFCVSHPYSRKTRARGRKVSASNRRKEREARRMGGCVGGGRDSSGSTSCVHKCDAANGVVEEYTAAITGESSRWMTRPRIKCIGFRSNADRRVCLAAYLTPPPPSLNPWQMYVTGPFWADRRGTRRSWGRPKDVHTFVILAPVGITNRPHGRATIT